MLGVTRVRDIFFCRPEFAAPSVLPFQVRLNPSAPEIGRLRKQGTATSAVFLFSFADATASHRVKDVWTACCEIYLQAQLARSAELHSFYLDDEQLFEMAYVDDAIICSWSPEHVFAVKRAEFVASIETLVEQVLAGVSHLQREAFVELGASLMQNHPRSAALMELCVIR